MAEAFPPGTEFNVRVARDCFRSEGGGYSLPPGAQYEPPTLTTENVDIDLVGTRGIYNGKLKKQVKVILPGIGYNGRNDFIFDGGTRVVVTNSPREVVLRCEMGNQITPMVGGKRRRRRNTRRHRTRRITLRRR